MSRRAGRRLLHFVDAVHQLILVAPVKHLDETGFRIVKTLEVAAYRGHRMVDLLPHRRRSR